MSEELSIHEAAKLLGCSTRTIRNYIRKGFISFSKVQGRKGLEYRFSKSELSSLFNSEKSGKLQPLRNETISFKQLYERVENEKRELHFKLEQAMIRLGQLESQRLMLAERAESLQQKEAEYRLKIEEQQRLLEEKEKIIQEKHKIIESLSRKKWWEFWKKPISQLLSEPSQL